MTRVISSAGFVAGSERTGGSKALAWPMRAIAFFTPRPKSLSGDLLLDILLAGFGVSTKPPV
jgi:hypothetical protein